MMAHAYPLDDSTAHVLAFWPPLRPAPVRVAVYTEGSTRWRDVSADVRAWDGRTLTFTGDALRARRLDATAQQATTRWRVTADGRTLEAHTARAEWRAGLCVITVAEDQAA